MKYIIDTDPGVDDAIAIMLGIQNNLDVIGFTLASGNIPAYKSEKNLKIIQEFLGTNIKMYKGKKENKCNHETAEYAHGKDGLGYAVFNDNMSRKTFSMKRAEDFIISASKKYKDDLTIICLGPLTNLASAIKKDPKLVNRLKHVVIMGTTYDPDNKNPYLEFNVNVDPSAAKYVLSAPFSDIRLVTHEVGVKSFVEKDYVLNLRNSNKLLSRFVGLISEKYIEFSYEHYNTIGLGTPDPTTIASIIDDSIVTFSPCNVEVISRGNEKGECHISLCDDSNIKVATDFDLEKFRKLFKKTFN
ncbi:MAG: nucleoside hydrolase [Tenericutes bacterium]|nr:nucleoside hydrolase [Mycoplasmatota bacterium]